MNNVNIKLVNAVDLYHLLPATAEVIKDELKLDFCKFFVGENTSTDFRVMGNDERFFSAVQWNSLSALLVNRGEKIFIAADEKDEAIRHMMRKADIASIFKMNSQDQQVGFLIIGEKRSGSGFTGQDVQILEIIADEVAIAVQNNLRFAEISQFNETLQKKIDTATHQLQHSNEKLKALDEAKDEFISMASHQLRTPLTSVKGYISMMLEGDAGDLNDQQKLFLNQAFVSSQRMVYLIADLLNVSRLKTGKFIIEPKPTHLPDVVATELDQLYETARARGLELNYDKPGEFPSLNLDETKVRQVIMNFVDNAIYYTPKGGKITVALKCTDESVEFTVNDTGLGVPKSDQHKLFTKFYRAGNARKARPDGTGLGLFMAKKVVVAQGGAIIFKSQEGKGSTFGFSFPRARLEVDPAFAPKPKSETVSV